MSQNHPLHLRTFMLLLIAPAQMTAPAAAGAIRIHPEYYRMSQNHPLLTRALMLLLVAPAQATAPVVAEATRMMTLQKKRGARTRIALLGASARGSATGSVTVMAAGTGIGIGIEIGIGTESGSVVEARAAAGWVELWNEEYAVENVWSEGWEQGKRHVCVWVWVCLSSCSCGCGYWCEWLPLLFARVHIVVFQSCLPVEQQQEQHCRVCGQEQGSQGHWSCFCLVVGFK